MTITQLRNEFKARIRFDELTKSGLSDYLKQEWKTLETLYAEGAVNRRTDYISDDMLALATGYDPQKTDDGFTVVRCLDLAYIYATKKHVRNMMMLFLGITEPEKQQTAEPTAEQKTKEQEQTEQPTAEQPTEEQQAEEQATAETETAQVAETENTYEHAVEMAKYAVKCGDGIQAIYRKGNEYKAGLLSGKEYAGRFGWEYCHTVNEDEPTPKRVFLGGYWRILVIFFPANGGYDYADRCEIRAIREHAGQEDYDDIANKAIRKDERFMEWELYDAETTSKRLKHYQEVAMKKFVEKTGIQV